MSLRFFLMRAANFADFFGIDVLKIYLISRNVKLFENCKKVQNHSTLLYSVYNIHICIHIRTTVWSEKEESAKRACSVSLLSVVIVITLLHLHFVIKQCQFLFCHDRFWHRTEQNSVSSFSVMKGFWPRTEQNSVSSFFVITGFINWFRLGLKPSNWSVICVSWLVAGFLLGLTARWLRLRGGRVLCTV